MMETQAADHAGPLSGLRVVEFAGIGPTPFACMMLADMGADVVRIERPGLSAQESPLILRGRRRVALDLRDARSLGSAKALAAAADVLVEGFRPGVMERLSLGPEELMGSNPRLVYARMTGWGQTGPRAHEAGHDINYISITGALEAIGPRRGPPSVPLNLVGDYGGGALYLAVGILAALHTARTSGRGQVVDCAICDGAASLMSLFHQWQQLGNWRAQRQANVLDGGAHFYGTYECADGRFIALGAIEPQFYAQLVKRAGLDPSVFSLQGDPSTWEDLRLQLTQIFLQRSAADWLQLLDGHECCVTPVLSLEESRRDPHLAARGVFARVDGVDHVAPAPRFMGTPSSIRPGAECTSVGAILDGWAH